MKKIQFSIFCFVFFFVTSSIKSQNIATTIGSFNSSTCAVGDTITLPVTINMVSGISVAALSLAIDFDTTKLRAVCTGSGASISCVTNLNANITSGFLSNVTNFSNQTPNPPFTASTRKQFRAAWFNLVPVAFNGLMFEIRFVVVGTGNSVVKWDVATPGNCEYADELAEVIPNCTFVDGNITCGSAPVCVPPPATISPVGTTSLCSGGSVVLNANTGSGLSYQWSNNGISISGATNSTYTATSAGSYSVTVSNAPACSTISSNVSVVVNGINTITFTSAAGTNAQTRCINNAITNITYATSGATGAIVSGLPAGVSGTWANNLFTISGTPTANGLFNYIVTMTGGCIGATNTATGSIVVNGNNTIALTSAAGTNAQTRCINTAITNITYTTTGATGATVSGLPSGVSSDWSNNSVTISGTPTATGNFTYTVTMTGGCIGGANTASGSIDVLDLPFLTNQPISQSVSMGQNAVFTIGHNSTNSTLQWQTDLGWGFQDLTNAGQYSGVNTPTLTVSNTAFQNNNQMFRCILFDGICSGDTSNIVSLSVVARQNTANVPARFNFQSVIRDTTGALVANRSLGVRITLNRGPQMGTLYSETHQLTSNSNGLITTSIGGGTPVVGSMDSIDWSLGDVSIKTEVDVNGGSNYEMLSSNQLLSVPYALFAQNSGNGTPGPAGPQGPMGPAGPQGIQGPAGPAGGGGGNGTLATVRTVGVTGVMYTVARVEASLDASGGEFVVSKGFCVDTLAVPTVDKGIAVSGGGLGAFELGLSGLEAGRLYYVRAYATTAAGTAYGQVLSFQTRALAVPSPTTESAYGVGAFGAQLRGSMADTASGGMALTARGFRWSQTSGFASAMGQDIPAQATAGQGFSAQLQGLTASTTYYFRAYASNALGTGYGAEVSFTTGNQPLATVQTQAASGITQTSALVAGAVTSDAGAAVTVRGFCYSTGNNPQISNDTVQAGAGLGTFSATLRNLNAGSTYYFRAFAVNAGGVGYGLEQSFQTPALATATITTNAVYGISNQSAYSGGSISSDGGSAVTQRGVAYDTTVNPTTAGSITSDGSGAGNYTSLMAGLTPSTTYYVRSYAINATGTAYGQERSFQTTAQASGPVTVPILGTQLVVKTDSNFIGGGNITSDGNSAITSLGICWNRTGMPTLSDSVVYFATPGLGSFDLPFQLPSGCNENFFIRAFAINAVGVGYGQEVGTTNGFLVQFGVPTPLQVGATSVTIQADITGNGGCVIQERGICWSTSPNPNVSNSFFKSQCGSGVGQSICHIEMLIPQTLYYFRIYAITPNGVFYSSLSTFTTDTTSGLFIGKNYGGGIIFHIDSTGNHGLICSPNDMGGVPWGCPSVIGGPAINISGTSSAVGTGAANTAFILASCNERPIAASLCADLVLNGYSDWYLPSQGELELMYNRLVINGLITFSMCWHWSSTQHYINPPINALLTSFCPLYDARDGHQKWVTEPRVRAIRSF